MYLNFLGQNAFAKKSFLKITSIILLLVLSLLFQFAFAEEVNEKIPNKIIKKVEPPFWYSGFKERDLQILLYGKNISKYEVKFDAKYAKLQKVNHTANPNYIFLDIKLKNQKKEFTAKITLSEGEKTVTNFDYMFKSRAKGSAKRKGFSAKDVVYLIMPDRFVNGDYKNDNVDGLYEKINRADDYGRHGGDIQGVIDSLDYLSDLGITQIWLNPVLENNSKVQSYHGYAVTDFYNIDARYGDNKKYFELSKKAKEKNIGIIKDVILNHMGLNNYLYIDPPAKDWFNYTDGKIQYTSHRHSALIDPYAEEVDKRGFTNGWFVSAMPDMNGENELFAKYLIQNSIWWIEYASLSGIRLDTYAYSGKKFLSEWTKAIYTEYPNFSVVGEEWHNNPVIVSHYQRGKNDPLGTPKVNSMIDFPMHDNLMNSLNTTKGWTTGMQKLYDFMVNDILYKDPNMLMTILDNHDMDRVAKTLDNDLPKLKMAMAYLLTMRGVPQIYYGTEILMKNDKDGDHGEIRREFPGGWKDHEKNAFTQTNLTSDEIEFLTFTKKLLNFRKNSKALKMGELSHFNPYDNFGIDDMQKNIYTYFRYHKNDVVMVVLNNNDSEAKLDKSKYKKFLSNKKTLRNIFTDEKLMLRDDIMLSPKSANIFVVK